VADLMDNHRKMQSVDAQTCFLAFTDGWGDEPIVRCEPVAQSTRDPRLVICSVNPPIDLKNTVVLYDRFSEGTWLPLSRSAQVGVLLGEIERGEEPDPAELDLVYWATVFANLDEAEEARRRLRPAS
jgi:hypothetical protein